MSRPAHLLTACLLLFGLAALPGCEPEVEDGPVPQIGVEEPPSPDNTLELGG